MENDQLFHEIDDIISQAKRFRARKQYPKAVEQYNKAASILEANSAIESQIKINYLDQWAFQLFEVEQFEPAANLYGKDIDQHLRTLKARIQTSDEERSAVFSALNYIICLANVEGGIVLANRICGRLLSSIRPDMPKRALQCRPRTLRGLAGFLAKTHDQSYRARIQDLIYESLPQATKPMESEDRIKVQKTESLPTFRTSQTASPPQTRRNPGISRKQTLPVSIENAPPWPLGPRTRQASQTWVEATPRSTSLPNTVQQGEASRDAMSSSRTFESSKSPAPQIANAHLSSVE
jgi:cell division protein ZapA (FtsZ GTPase activity inhibitor)